MSERRKVISEVMSFDCINTMWEFTLHKLHLDAETEEGIAIKALMALAWITGAHFGLAFPEKTLPLLTQSDEVYHLVSDTWRNIIGDSLPPEDIDQLVQCAMESEDFLPLVSLIPKDFSFSQKSN